jgi:hypothetical protein
MNYTKEEDGVTRTRSYVKLSPEKLLSMVENSK